jgi:hypothetical protein
MVKPNRTLPNELLVMIGEYVYSQKHSNFYRLSKTTKNIMDSLAKKEGFLDYLSRCLILSNVCYDCRGKLSWYDDFFFVKNYKLCRNCAYNRPKISMTQIKKTKVLTEQNILSADLPSISYRNEYKVTCKLYLESDVEELQNFLYTQEQIQSFYDRKERRIDRRMELEEARESRKLEINKTLSKFSNYIMRRVIEESSECEKYIRTGVPKNVKNKQRIIDKMLAEAERYEVHINYLRKHSEIFKD